MYDLLTIIAVTSGAFIATNLDNLILLIALYSRYEKQPKTVTGGYLSGMVIVGMFCFVIGVGGGFVPITYLGLLGIIPVLMGIVSLLQLFQTKKGGAIPGSAIDNTRKVVFLAVLMTQLSNSADSIITFSVLLADSSRSADYLVALTFLAMVCLFAGFAYYSLKHRSLSDYLDRYGRYITPFILILVGIYIISNTASDLMPG